MMLKTPKDIASEFCGYEGAVETAICFDREEIANLLKESFKETQEVGRQALIEALIAHKNGSPKSRKSLANLCRMRPAMVQLAFAALACGLCETPENVVALLKKENTNLDVTKEWCTELFELASQTSVLLRYDGGAYYRFNEANRFKFVFDGAKAWVENLAEIMWPARLGT